MIAFPVLIVLVACWPSWVRLHAEWTDWARTTYTHGYLVVAVCVYLLWRGHFRVVVPASSGEGRGPVLAALCLAGAAWVLCVRAGLSSVEWLLLPILLLLSIWAAYGLATAKRSAFAVLFLYFAIPLWSSINGLFQWSTVYVVRGLLRVAGTPAYFAENTVHIPSGTFEIEGGCSGLHFVMVGLATGALMGELRSDGWRGRAYLLGLAGALAVITNWLRVLSIILAGHYTHMQSYLVARSHYAYGWLLFTAAMAVFFMLERRMKFPLRSSSTPPAATLDRGSLGTLLQGPWMNLTGVASILMTAAVVQSLSARSAAPVMASAAPPAGWSTREPEVWAASIHGADRSQHEGWLAPSGQRIDHHEYLFLSQYQGKELGGYDNDLSAGEGHVAAVRYRVGNRLWMSPVPAQLSYAVQSMTKLRSVASSVLVWRAPCVPDCPAAEELLRGTVP